ncbi:MAG: hypothetical protein Q8N84_03330, partial [bacterium]|nr:hypothetical protein [bacterium]
MRRKLLIVLLVILLALGLVLKLPLFLKNLPTTKNASLVANGSFEFEEISAANHKLPTGWNLVGSCQLGETITAETVTQPDSVYSGKQSLKVYAGKGCGIAQKINFSKKGSYDLQIQIQEIDGKATAIFKNEGGKVVFQTFFTKRGQFQAASIPIDSTSLREGSLEIVIDTTIGTFLVDDINVTETDVPKLAPKNFDDITGQETNRQNQESNLEVLWQKISNKGALAAGGNYSIRPIYFVPADMEVYPEYTSAIVDSVNRIRSWYARELGGRTFNAEALVVYHDSLTYDEVRCGGNQVCLGNPEGVSNYFERVGQVFFDTSGTILLIFGQGAGGWAGAYTFGGSNGGRAEVGDAVLTPISGGFRCPRCIRKDDTYGRALSTIGHELGHSFDLPHPPVALNQLLSQNGVTPPASIMVVANYPQAILYDLQEEQYGFYSEKNRLLNSYFFGGSAQTKNAPEINWVDPRRAVRTGLLRIEGRNFSFYTPNESQVLIGGTAIPGDKILSWRPDSIEVIIPQSAQGSSLKVKTNETSGALLSNDYLFALFDKPENPIEVVESPPTNIQCGRQGCPDVFHWRRNAVLGNVRQVVFKIFKVLENSEELFYLGESEFLTNPETFYLDLSKSVTSRMTPTTSGQVYRWEYCSYNYFEQREYCRTGNFTVFLESDPSSSGCSCTPTFSMRGNSLDSCRPENYFCRGPDTRNSTRSDFSIRGGECYFNSYWCDTGGVPPAGVCDCSLVEANDMTQYYSSEVSCLGTGRVLLSCREPLSGVVNEVTGMKRRWLDVDGGKCIEDTYSCRQFGIPQVITPLTASYDRAQGSLDLSAGLSDNGFIKTIAVFYREDSETASGFGSPDPSRGWVYLNAFESFCGEASGLCAFSYRWGVPSHLINNGKNYLFNLYVTDNARHTIVGNANSSGQTAVEGLLTRTTFTSTSESVINICAGVPNSALIVNAGVCYKCLNEQASGEVTGEVCRAAKANVCQSVGNGQSILFETYRCDCQGGLVTGCTALPQFGTCAGCSGDAWGGCTPPEECRLINDQSLCTQQGKPGAPCCLHDVSCSPSHQYACGYGDPNTYCSKCQRFINYDPWCTTAFQTDCGAGAPAKPRLKSPANAATLSGAELSSVTLTWYSFGEALPIKCGETLKDSWPKWDDCNGEWHWGTPARCIPEVGDGNNAGDRSCWGYACAKGSFGIPPAWRFYKVLAKGPNDGDFREVCSLSTIPNPSNAGGSISADKTSCSFTPTVSGDYQWFVRAGYSTGTQGGIYVNQTDSAISSFTFSLPAPSFQQPTCSVLSISPATGTKETEFTANVTCSSGTSPFARLYLMARKQGTTEGVRLTPDNGLCSGETTCTTTKKFTPASFAGLGSEGTYDLWLAARTVGPDGQLETSDDGRCTDILEGLAGVQACGAGSRSFALTPAPTPADAFPTVGQALRIEGSGKNLTAILTGNDDTAIEKVLVHYAPEGQANWQKVVEVNCGQKDCSLSQGFTLPSDLAPGNYTFVASLWDHDVPAAGQHFGTTGASAFPSSGCTPTSTYCYSDQLRFNLAVQPPASNPPQCSALTLDKTQAASEDQVNVAVTAKSGSSNFKATNAITLNALRVSDSSTHGILTFSLCDGVDAKTTSCTDATQGFTPTHAVIPQAGLYKFYVAMVNQEGGRCDDLPGTPAAAQCGCGAKELTVTTPPAADTFPIVTQALRIEGAGKDFRATLAGEDNTVIEIIVVHYALEGQSNWQEAVKGVGCGQRQCSLNQAFTLPQELSPGRYQFIASLWDHAVPAAGQHFGTTGANFESSDCSPTATYCHSDQLQFTVAIQPPAQTPPQCQTFNLTKSTATLTEEVGSTFD